MSQEINFKELERKAYLTYHQDGLIDITLGTMILGFGLDILTDVAGILAWLPILFFPLLKNQITIPRIGYVKFSARRGRSFILIILVADIIIFGFLLLAYFVSRSLGVLPPEFLAWLGRNYMMVFGLLAAALLATMGLGTGLKRLYTYAGITLLLSIIGTWVGLPAVGQIIALGVLILSTGAWMLSRFLRAYPIVAEEENNDAS